MQAEKGKRPLTIIPQWEYSSYERLSLFSVYRERHLKPHQQLTFLYWLDPGQWNEIQLASFQVLGSNLNLSSKHCESTRLLFNLHNCTGQRFPLEATAEMVEQLED